LTADMATGTDPTSGGVFDSKMIGGSVDVLDGMTDEQVKELQEKEKRDKAALDELSREQDRKLDELAQSTDAQANVENRETAEVVEEVIERMDSCAERVSASIQADLEKKKDLQEKIKQAEEDGDEEEANRLLAELGSTDDAIKAKIDGEAAD